jgi:hypothetical protein
MAAAGLCVLSLGSLIVFSQVSADRAQASSPASTLLKDQPAFLRISNSTYHLQIAPADEEEKGVDGSKERFVDLNEPLLPSDDRSSSVRKSLNIASSQVGQPVGDSEHSSLSTTGRESVPAVTGRQKSVSGLVRVYWHRFESFLFSLLWRVGLIEVGLYHDPVGGHPRPHEDRNSDSDSVWSRWTFEADPRNSQPTPR